MLEEASEVGRAGSTRQLRCGFLDTPAPAVDTTAERITWETEVLGQPVSAHPLALVRVPSRATSLRRLAAAPGKPVAVYAVRIPGWPGGGGIFLGDGDMFVVARLDKALAADRSRRPYWRPLRLTGRWRRDEWDGGWFQVESAEVVSGK